MRLTYILAGTIMLLYILSIPISGGKLGIAVTIAYIGSPLMSQAAIYNIVLEMYVVIMFAFFLIGIFTGGNKDKEKD